LRRPRTPSAPGGRVPLHHGVEELDGRGLSPQELVRVVEVLEGLCDQPLGVVVELFVLVSGNDVPGEGKMRLVW
jgi:hypothetical protein